MGSTSSHDANQASEEKLMMKVPTSYAEWVDALELFRLGALDEETLTAMEQGALDFVDGQRY